jgi:phenylpropionate dioxygenase-like ring-hydroxylating dioxygenase large terminal subunit
MARRELEHTPLPTPNGWFAVAYGRDLIPGDVRSIRYFGEDMVLFRTRTGQARVLDPWCPHLGAHVAEGGRVVGEALRCPFHAWQFDGESGRCVSIPYCDKIPPRARLRAWDVQEKNGMIFVWHHVDQKPPEWDFPELPELSDPAWSEPRCFEFETRAHVQDTHENNNDPVHFQYVHGSGETLPTDIEYSSDGRHYRAVSRAEAKTPAGPFEYELVRDSWGLGLTAVRFAGIGSAGLLMFSSTTPVEEGRTLSRWLLTATSEMIDSAGEEFITSITRGVMQDLPIWNHKVHRAKPVLCEADKHLAEFRKWARQFYSSSA